MKTPRREFSARTKREAWQRANGHCEANIYHQFVKGTVSPDIRCNEPLTRGCHYDHIDPDWFSKDNELENCQVLCHLCHKEKTAKDVKDIAKSKRIIDKRMGIKKKKGFRGWRKFDGGIVWNR